MSWRDSFNDVVLNKSMVKFSLQYLAKLSSASASNTTIPNAMETVARSYPTPWVWSANNLETYGFDLAKGMPQLMGIKGVPGLRYQQDFIMANQPAIRITSPLPSYLRPEGSIVHLFHGPIFMCDLLKNATQTIINVLSTQSSNMSGSHIVLCAACIFVALAIMVGYLSSKKVTALIFSSPEQVNIPQLTSDKAAEAQALRAPFWNVNQTSVAQAIAHQETQTVRATLTAANARAAETRNYNEATAPKSQEDESSLALQPNIVAEEALESSIQNNEPNDGMVETEGQNESEPFDATEEPTGKYEEMICNRDMVIESLQAANKVQEEKNKALEDTIQDQQNTIGELSGTVREQKITIDDQNGVLEERAVTIDEQKVTIEQRDGAMEERNNAIEERNRTIEQQKVILEQHNATIEQQNRVVTERDDTIEQQNSTIEQYSGTIKKQNKTIESLESKEGEQAAKIEKLTMTNDAQKQSLDDPLNPFGVKDQEISNLKQENSEVRDIIFGLKSANGDIHEKLDGEVENHQSTRDSLHSLSDRLATAEGNIKQQRLEISTAEACACTAQVEAHAEELNSQLAQEQQTSTNLQGERDELQRQLNESVRAEPAAMQSDRINWQNFCDAEDGLTALQAEFNVLEAEFQGSAVEIETLKEALEKGFGFDMASTVSEIAHLKGSEDYYKIRVEESKEEKTVLQASIKKMAARLRGLESTEVKNGALKRHVLILKDQLDAVGEKLRHGKEELVDGVGQRYPAFEAQMTCFGLLAKHLMAPVKEEDEFDLEHILGLLNGTVSGNFENSPPRVRLPAHTLYGGFAPRHSILLRTLPLAVEAHSEDILDPEAGLWDEEVKKDKGKGREQGGQCQDGADSGGGGDDSDDDEEEDDDEGQGGDRRKGNGDGKNSTAGGSGGDLHGGEGGGKDDDHDNDQEGDGRSGNNNGSNDAAQDSDGNDQGGDDQNNNKDSSEGGAESSRNSFQTPDDDEDDDSDDDDPRDDGSGKSTAPPSIPGVFPEDEEEVEEPLVDSRLTEEEQASTPPASMPTRRYYYNDEVIKEESTIRSSSSKKFSDYENALRSTTWSGEDEPVYREGITRATPSKRQIIRRAGEDSARRAASSESSSDGNDEDSSAQATSSGSSTTGNDEQFSLKIVTSSDKLARVDFPDKSAAPTSDVGTEDASYQQHPKTRLTSRSPKRSAISLLGRSSKPVRSSSLRMHAFERPSTVSLLLEPADEQIAESSVSSENSQTNVPTTPGVAAGGDEAYEPIIANETSFPAQIIEAIDPDTELQQVFSLKSNSGLGIVFGRLGNHTAEAETPNSVSDEQLLSSAQSTSLPESPTIQQATSAQQVSSTEAEPALFSDANQREIVHPAAKSPARVSPQTRKAAARRKGRNSPLKQAITINGLDKTTKTPPRHPSPPYKIKNVRSASPRRPIAMVQVSHSLPVRLYLRLKVFLRNRTSCVLDPDAMVDIPATTQTSHSVPVTTDTDESETDAMVLDDPYEGTTPMNAESEDDIHVDRRDQIDIEYDTIAGLD